MITQTVLHFFGKELHNRLEVAGLERLVASGIGGPKVATDWFEARVRCTFSRPMDTHQRFMRWVLTTRPGSALHLVALMDRGAKRFRQICYPALSNIFFHLSDFDGERFISKNVSNPAGKIAATRMTFQGCGR